MELNVYLNNMKKILLILLIPLGLFGQGKISEMPAASSVTGSELMEIVQGGVNKKITLSQTGSTFYVPLSRTITINGTVYDLSANRSWSVGNVFTSGVYSNPSWITSFAATKITGTLTETQGGTGFAAYTTGDILYSSATNTLQKLGIGTNGYLLTSNGSIPSWQPAPISLPSQTGHNGEFLTTNGTTASWSAVSQTFSGLSDVSFSGLASNDFAKYNGSAWVNRTPAQVISDIGAEVPLTFSTGLTRSTNTVTVNTSQNISTLSNLTSNGLVTTSGGTGALSVTVPGSGVLTWLATPSWTNFSSAITGTAPFWSLSSGGTFTGTNTLTAGSNPLILSTSVTTGTGATAGMQIAANSLTTGTALSISSSSATSGALARLISTSTANNYVAGTNGAFQVSLSGANANSTRYSIGVSSIVSNTGTMSTNYAGYFKASGGSFNRSLYCDGTVEIAGAGLIEVAPSTTVALAITDGTNGIMSINTNTQFVDFQQTTALKGTATNDDANSGYYGETSQSLVAVGSAVSLTTNTTANVTSLSLTAGDWVVSGSINFSEGSATVTARTGSITTTSATMPTNGTEVENGYNTTTLTSKNSVNIPPIRFSLSTTTTVYLVGRSVFSAGTSAAYGRLSAIRIR